MFIKNFVDFPKTLLKYAYLLLYYAVHWRKRMGIEPTPPLLGAATDLKSTRGTSPLSAS